MLVCVFFCACCTRDRGCSAHPVFPAPSFLEERVRTCKTSGAFRRENADAFQQAICNQAVWNLNETTGIKWPGHSQGRLKIGKKRMAPSRDRSRYHVTQ